MAATIFAQNIDSALVVFTLSGMKQQEYKVTKSTDVMQYLVHPAGKKLLLLTSVELLWIELR